ncbi:MAG: hypothetical protein ACREPF_02800 [Rhodanobacteraceae bacterium]
MDPQWDFFKKSDTSLGVFYPLHYVIAGYANLDDARAAEAAFREAGVSAEDVRAVTGEFVATQLESREGETWLDQVENKLVEVVGTEKRFIAHDRDHARKGGAFLFVFAPNDEQSARAKSVLAAHPPEFARRYLRIAIEEIVVDPSVVYSDQGDRM